MSKIMVDVYASLKTFNARCTINISIVPINNVGPAKTKKTLLFGRAVQMLL